MVEQCAAAMMVAGPGEEVHVRSLIKEDAVPEFQQWVPLLFVRG